MLKLVSVNIERSKHLPLVGSFLSQADADVVCIQELMEYDIPYFESVLGRRCFFTGTTRHPAEGKPGIFGLGIFSRPPITHSESRFYHGTGIPDAELDFTDAESKYRTESHAVAIADIEKDGERFKIATTHFTWTPDGKPNDHQRRDVEEMVRILDGLELVLVGDFNAPRGGEIFSALSKRYKDNIPAHYVSSIDGTLHRAGPLPVMVDGLFTTPSYLATDVELCGGVSDHMAIVATLSRNAQ